MMSISSRRTLPSILAILALCALATALILRPAGFSADVAQFAPVATAPIDVKRAPIPGRTYAFDALLTDDAQFPITSATIGLAKTGTVGIAGWAIDSHSMKPAAALMVTIDRGGAPYRVTTYGVPRPDVAAAIKNPDALNSGFRANVSFAGVVPGLHHIRFLIVSADGSKTELPTDVRILLQK